MVVSKTKKTLRKLLRGDAIIISDNDNNYASGLRYREPATLAIGGYQNHRTEQNGIPTLPERSSSTALLQYLIKPICS
jgi:hypothetical protein